QRRAAKLRGRLQPEDAHAAQRLNGIRGQRAEFLSTVPGCLELLAAAPDGGEQFLAGLAHEVPSGRSTGMTSVANSSVLRMTCSCVLGPIANNPMSCPNPPGSSYSSRSRAPPDAGDPTTAWPAASRSS